MKTTSKPRLRAWIARMMQEPRTTQPPPCTMDDMLARAAPLNAKICARIRWIVHMRINTRQPIQEA